MIFANSPVVFDGFFPQYAHKLQSISLAPIDDIAKCHSGVFGSRKTARVRSLAPDAILLFRAITEFIAIGINADTITIGGELTQRAVDQYASFPGDLPSARSTYWASGM